jgi:hypothetical protein
LPTLGAVNVTRPELCGETIAVSIK